MLLVVHFLLEAGEAIECLIADIGVWVRSVGKAGRVDISSVLSSRKKKQWDLLNVPHSSRVNQKWQRGWGKGRSYPGRTAAICSGKSQMRSWTKGEEWRESIRGLSREGKMRE